MKPLRIATGRGAVPPRPRRFGKPLGHGRTWLLAAAWILAGLPLSPASAASGTSAASAAPAPTPPRRSLWLMPLAGNSNYAMRDVNRDLDGLPLAAGVSLPHIRGGRARGLEAGLDLSRSESFLLSYERLDASTRTDSRFGRLVYDIPANVFLFGYERSVHAAPETRVGLAWLLGVLNVKGKTDLPIPEIGNVGAEVGGRAFVLEARLRGAREFYGRVGILGWASYRYARAYPTTVGGATLHNSDRSQMALDYSGFLWRAGLRLRLF